MNNPPQRNGIDKTRITMGTRPTSPLFAPQATQQWAPTAPITNGGGAVTEDARAAAASSHNTTPAGNLNWALVHELRDQVAEKLAVQLKTLTNVADMATTRRQLGRSLIRPTLEAFRTEAIESGDDARFIPAELDPQYARAVESALFGAGRWQPLLDDPDVENIIMRGMNVFMSYGDRQVKVDPVADSEDELISELQFRAGEAGKKFSPIHPEMTMNLGDTHRLHAYAFDVSSPRVSIVIRQHKHRNVTLEQLSNRDNLMPAWVAHFLDSAVKARKSLIIGGDQGSGKTTLLRALGHAIPPLESVGIIETDPELFLEKLKDRNMFLSLTARDGSDTAADLQRLIVGEVRGPEAATMFQAMQAGAGSMSTIHAQHPWAIVERLVTASAQQGVLTQDDAYRQIATNINLVIFIGVRDYRDRGGKLTRYIEEIFEIDGFQETGDGSPTPIPARNPIYRHDQPVPTFQPSQTLREALIEHGWNSTTVPAV